MLANSVAIFQCVGAFNSYCSAIENVAVKGKAFACQLSKTSLVPQNHAHLQPFTSLTRTQLLRQH